MNQKKRVLVCEFHEESNTFNPIVMPLESFQSMRYAEGEEAYALSKKLPCAFHGTLDAVEEAGAIAVPTISLYAGSGGRVDDAVYDLLVERMQYYIKAEAPFDAIFVCCHGATCTPKREDACGDFVAFLRQECGESVVIAASFDLHANITERMRKNADIVCGYQTYPHVDFYETGYRAGKFGMRKLLGEPTYQASLSIPMMVPPAGYTSLEEPFKGVIDAGHALIASGEILDFTVFQVQPWLDVADTASVVTVIAADPDVAKRHTEELAARLYENRDGYWPKLLSIDAIIDHAEDPAVPKPVVLVDAADSPNGGAVGDSVAVALRLHERGSKLRAGMFVRDAEAVKKAFAVGVGNSATFTIGAGITPNVPGPLVANCRVRSLHDGEYRQEGPAGRGYPCNVGLSAVLQFENVDIMVCEAPIASGDPQILRHFGIEPKLLDLVVVKANTSFRVPYSAFATEFCLADTPGAGDSNLKRLNWLRLPHPFYPFDLPEDYELTKAEILR